MDNARRSAAREAELAARSSYGKLLSIVASRTRDIAAAEDALADAFAAALAQWPRNGVPDNPVGWLLTVARRSIGHTAGRRRTVEQAADVVRILQDERAETAVTGFGDERLKLMFVCTHPAIAVDAQTPLMLQMVLGLDAARIAGCFLVSSASMGQRLVRAKRKVRDAGIGFVIPEPSEAPQRVSAVLAAIYAAYGTAWEDVAGADAKLLGLADEALWLARLTVELAPAEPEAQGLLSMMLHCEARRGARRDAGGAFVALRDQDTALWSSPMIVEAEALLRDAARHAAPGRFQTEAAIQSIHAHQGITGETFTGPLVRLYDLLAQIAPTTGVLVARAVAHAENGDAAGALRQLDGIDGADSYQPWWAARARSLWLAGDTAGARTAAGRAAGLSGDPSIRRFLLGGGYRDREGSLIDDRPAPRRNRRSSPHTASHCP